MCQDHFRAPVPAYVPGRVRDLGPPRSHYPARDRDLARNPNLVCDLDLDLDHGRDGIVGECRARLHGSALCDAERVIGPGGSLHGALPAEPLCGTYHGGG